MATSPRPPLPPPTRQLFVRFPARRPRSLRDVEDLFCEFGRLKHAHLGKSGDVAFVSYSRLDDAREAVKRLDRREHRGYELRVEHSRVTRLLAVGDVPLRGVPNAEAVVREVAAAHGAVEWAMYDAHKGTVFVLMRSEAEAARAVSELQGRERGGWRWEVEFYKEGSIRPPPAARRDSHQAGAPASQGTNATPAAVPPPPPAPREVAHHGVPAPAAISTAPVAVNAVPHAPLPPPPPTPPPSASVVVGAASNAPTPVASTTPAPASGKDDAREPPRSPSPSAQKRRARSQSRSRSPSRSRSGSRSRFRSRSRSRSRPRSPSRSPPRKGRRTTQRSRSWSRLASKSPPPSRSAAPSSLSPSVSRDPGRRRRRRSASPDASPPSPPPPVAPIECAKCRRLVTHLSGADHHSLTEDEQTKQLVKAWFSGNFELASKRDASRKPESIRRLRFLDEHVNPFLASVGLPTWTTRTPLYANWFQREVLRLSAAEVGHSRPLLLHRRTSLQAYAERLRRLLAAVERHSGDRAQQ